MAVNNRKVMIRAYPDVWAAAGLDPESDGAVEVTAVLRKYGVMLSEAGREVAATFHRAEWCMLADVANGLLWGDDDPAVALVAQAEDAHSLDRRGDKWFDAEAADAAVADLAVKLRRLTPIQAEAVAVALRRFWRDAEAIGMTEDRWWHPAFRPAKREDAE